ncbi:hypothetical protein JXA40_06375 [bacterium]|nr:hypothetical protein [candidate division CSSED10-310 bacterium]
MSILRFCFLAIALLSYLLAISRCLDPLTDKTIQRLLVVHIPLIYLSFSLSHLIYLLASGKQATGYDAASYFLLPVFLCCACLTHRIILLQQLLPVIGIILTAVKTVSLVGHAAGTLRIPGRKKVRAWVVPLLVMTPVLPAGFQVMDRMPLEGDEPYFLLLTHSLIQDQDINLENNYLNGDSLKFMNERLVPQLWDNYVNGQLMSRQTSLLPALLIPGYRIAGREGAVFTIMILSSLLAFGIFQMVLAFIPSVRSAFISTILIMFSLPVVLYTNKLYTAVPGALLGVLTLWMCRRLLSKPGYVAGAFAGILLAGWLKTRLLVLTLPMVIATILMNRIPIRKLSRLLFLILILIVLLGIVNTVIYGSPLIRYQFKDLTGTDLLRITRGILGQLWDIQYGILPASPVLVFALLGLVPFVLRNRTDVCPVILWTFAVLPYFLIIAAYAELIGGICSKGRFSVAWVPMLAVPLAYAIHTIRKGILLSVFRSFCLISIGFTVLMFCFPRWQINMPGGSDRLWEALSRMLQQDLLGVLPAFDRPDFSTWLHGTILMGMSIILVVAAGLRRSSAPSPDPATPAAILILLSICSFLPWIQDRCSSAWMEVEDATFTKHRVQTHWEEPYDWDSPVVDNWPYRAGIQMGRDGTARRTMPLRKTGHSLEIIAAGIARNGIVPTLIVTGGQEPPFRIRMRSDRFESYSIPWNPDDLGDLEFAVERQPEPAESAIVIDKIRLRPGRIIYRAPVAGASQLLPVHFGSQVLTNFSVSQNTIRQGQPLNAVARIDSRDPQNPYDCRLRLIQNYRRIEQTCRFSRPGETGISVDIPFDMGTGSFELMIRNVEPGIPPHGPGMFRKNGWVYLGDVRIEPFPEPISSGNRDLLASVHSGDMDILPWSVHLSGGSDIDLPVQSEGMYSSIVLISNMTDIFEMIPFQTVVGSITVSTALQDETHPLIIGRQTAEAMCELPYPRLKLAHPVPRIVKRIPARVDWPPIISGMEYNSLVFLSELSLEHPGTIRKLRISSQNHHGVLHLYAIGLTKQS